MAFSLPFFIAMAWFSTRRASTAHLCAMASGCSGFRAVRLLPGQLSDFPGALHQRGTERLILFVPPNTGGSAFGIVPKATSDPPDTGALALCYAGITSGGGT